jgi:DNA-binding transcriptional ArsR family regulator
VGVFVVDADVLARARFGTSRLVETAAGLSILHRTDVLPWHRDWRDAHVTAWRERLAGDPVAAALIAHAYGPSWIADFLTVPPAAPDLPLERELEHLESLSDAQIRADLAVVREPLPPEASAAGLAATVADLLRWVWDTTIRPEWPRRRRVLQADVVARTPRLSTEGWSGVLRDLAPGVRWLGDGLLQVNTGRFPPRDIRGGDLLFFAAHSRGGSVQWRLPDRYALVYPVSGSSAAESAVVPDALARLLGPTRARVLVLAQAPVSTTALTALTGLPLGSVGGHLRVLLDAGLLERRRAGRHVLYWCSDTGTALLAAGASSLVPVMP